MRRLSGSALFALFSTFLVTVDIAKSYMNQDFYHTLMGAKLKPLKRDLEQIMPSYIIPIKIEIRHIEFQFRTHFVCYHQETFRTGID